MEIIEDIIEILSKEEVNLENALIKTKILLFKMGEKSLLKWVNSELNGYEDNVDLPNYRIIHTAVFGTATSGRARWTNHPLPIYHLTEEEQKICTEILFTESISSLESLSNSTNLSSHIPTEFCPKFNEGLGKGIYVESAHRHITGAQILQILTQVRSRLLDFLLELSDSLPNGENLNEKSKNINVKELFNKAIFGNNTTIIIGDRNTLDSAINDISDLFEVLKEYHVGDTELEDLNDAINADTGDNNIKHYGNNVKKWIQKVSHKAIEKETITQIIIAIKGFLS